MLKTSVAPLAFAFLASVASAQIVVNVDDVGCQDGFNNVNALTNGVPASATVSFDYNSATQRLTLVVSNTSPVIGGEHTPLLTRIAFNAPELAVTSMSIVSQTGSGGATPAFSLATDFTPNNGGVNGLCFGDFDVELFRSNLNGGIANPAATLVSGPSGAAVTGPVTFVLAVNGPGAANITTSAFAHSLSRNGTLANVACKFQGGGVGGNESGTIGNSPDCSAGGWVVGTPSLGSTLTFVQTGGVGCCGCLVISLDPTPTVWEGISLPVGLPFFAVISTCFTQNYRTETFDLQIPAIPELVGYTFYGAVLLVDSSLTQFSASDQFPLTITL